MSGGVRSPAVLLVCDEGLGSLAAARALKAAGYAPIVAVSRPGTYVARSRAAADVVRLPDPAASVDAFVAAAAAVAHSFGVAAVLPGTEPALRAVTGREDAFGEIVVGTSPTDALDRATDKRSLDALATEAGLDAPGAFDLDSETADEALQQLPYPVVLKPARSILPQAAGTLASVAVERVESPEEAQRVLADGQPRIAQRYVEGELEAVAGVAWRGELVCATRQRSPRIWPPGTGITAYGHGLERDAELERRVGRLVELVGWSGIFQVQFIHSGPHRYAIDFNPRVYGSIALAIASGHNLPAIWVDLLLGREPRIGRYRPGARYRVEEDDLQALVAEVRRGRPAAALAGLAPRPRTAHGVFSLRDPGPLAVTFKKSWERLRRRPAAA